MPITLDGTNGVTTNSGTLISATTIGVGGATPSTSGAGITFPATASASSNANTLDDYEEGTFTATLTGGTTPPSSPPTTTGYYTKIGNLVTVNVQFNNANTTGATGAAQITGLPFTSNSVGPTTGSGWSEKVPTTLTCTYVNVSTTTLVYLTSEGATLSWSSAGAGTYLGATITYRVA
jgi:hypothetical protein